MPDEEPTCPAQVHGPDEPDCIHCPECERGVVVDAGPMERDTGHVPYACTACAFSG